MIIAQISDSHILLPHQDTSAWQRRAEDLESCIQHINALQTAPALIVHTGDLAHNGTAAHYAMVRELLAPARAPLLPVVGNRDDRAHLLDAFHADGYFDHHFPFVQYAFDSNDISLVAIDTRSDISPRGNICKTRLAHLDSMLKARAERDVIIIMHHPPVPISALKKPFQFETEESAHALVTLLNSHQCVKRILCGHTHRSDFFNAGAIPASSAPSVATQIRVGKYPTTMIKKPVYHLHDVAAGGVFDTSSQVVGNPGEREQIATS